MMSTSGKFVPPPEAPVFRPTWEEFQDPLEYISKIRNVAQRSGICKIIPPREWNPPFSVDVDSFRFTPRIQRLNELEAKTRIKLNFLDHLAKFWELQGLPLKIPLIDNKYLDLHALYKAVNDNNFVDTHYQPGALRELNWSRIASCLGYQGGRGIGSILRQHYEKVLFPYDIFMASQKGVTENETKQDDKEESKVKLESKKTSVTVKLEKLEQFDKPMSFADSKDSFDIKMNDGTKLSSEMRRLQYYGAGPKTALPESEVSLMQSSDVTPSLPVVSAVLSSGPFSKVTRMKTKSVSGRMSGGRMSVGRQNTSRKQICCTCEVSGDSESILICDGCDAVFHLYCLIPPLTEMPHGDWRCRTCLAKECRKSTEVYGFETATREYSLQSFGIMADQFKRDYFDMPIHLVPCSDVEREFWRLVNCIEEDVVVEYGADIHTSDCGSGFPTRASSEGRPLDAEEEKYVDAGWNLNNLPSLSQSVLQYVNADISGMKVPWCYVGMCFSSFAWHIEDHWSYSVNYLHWGEPKTWYGVPGSKAELLEECMKRNAPELFEQSPDLLHQLTTIMNPNTLMEFGVPVVRTNQHAGEYIVTFPRAYHAGFNQGYNFAEAVNFCPSDWIPIGRACVDHYRTLKHQCVFSHEELVCKMSADPDQLGHSLALMVHNDLLAMVEYERDTRRQLLDIGMCEAEKEAFELLPDDERQCDYCKTTCFFSAITCSCTDGKLVCLHHADKLCHCPPTKLCLKYRYTLDELLSMLHRLKVRSDELYSWIDRARTLLDSSEPPGEEGEEDKRSDVSVFKKLIAEARNKSYPQCALLDALIFVVEEADCCSTVIGQLVSKSLEQKTVLPDDRLTIAQLRIFIEQVNTMRCTIKDSHLLDDLLKRVNNFQEELIKETRSSTPLDDIELHRLLSIGDELAIKIPELEQLRKKLSMKKDIEEICTTPRLLRKRSLTDIVRAPLTFVLPKRKIARRTSADSTDTTLEFVAPAPAVSSKKRLIRTLSTVSPVGGVKKGKGKRKEGKVRGAKDGKEDEEKSVASEGAAVVEWEDEKCSADRCSTPLNDEVEWVQCDGCQLWFHFHCIGLVRDDIGEHDDYVCRQCSKSTSDDCNDNDTPYISLPPQDLGSSLGHEGTKSDGQWGGNILDPFASNPATRTGLNGSSLGSKPESTYVLINDDDDDDEAMMGGEEDILNGWYDEEEDGEGVEEGGVLEAGGEFYDAGGTGKAGGFDDGIIVLE